MEVTIMELLATIPDIPTATRKDIFPLMRTQDFDELTDESLCRFIEKGLTVKDL